MGNGNHPSRRYCVLAVGVVPVVRNIKLSNCRRPVHEQYDLVVDLRILHGIDPREMELTSTVQP